MSLRLLVIPVALKYSISIRYLTLGLTKLQELSEGPQGEEATISFPTGQTLLEYALNYETQTTSSANPEGKQIDPLLKQTFDGDMH